LAGVAKKSLLETPDPRRANLMRIGYAKHRSRSHPAVIRVYDESGKLIETHEHARQFQRAVNRLAILQYALLKSTKMS